VNRRVRTASHRTGGARRNVSRRARAARVQRIAERFLWAAGLTGALAGAVLVSLFFVFVHDLFTQSGYFEAHEVRVEGAERLTAGEIRALTGIRPGTNILGVNLSAARRGLLSHPWVAEAEVRRELPARLHIKIREHVPVAIIDVGARFLLNAEGEVFKVREAADPDGLPVVSGLTAADLRAAERSGHMRRPHRLAATSEPAAGPFRSRPMEAVVQVLALARAPNAALPSRQLQAIRVDRELGITVTAFEEGASVRLGYDDFAVKYRLLADLLAFFKTQAQAVDFDRIDLSDVHRVIVNPVRSDPATVGGG
jgi:cell division protein FtsQ